MKRLLKALSIGEENKDYILYTADLLRFAEKDKVEKLIKDLREKRRLAEKQANKTILLFNW